jgi:hypothetical protein
MVLITSTSSRYTGKSRSSSQIMLPFLTICMMDRGVSSTSDFPNTLISIPCRFHSSPTSGII